MQGQPDSQEDISPTLLPRSSQDDVLANAGMTAAGVAGVALRHGAHHSEAQRYSALLPEWMAFGRRKAMAELVATEDSYVASLKQLVHGYLNRLPHEVGFFFCCSELH